MMCLILPTLTLAQGNEEMHMQSAFAFAKKKDWGNAISQARAAHSDVLAKYFVWEYLKDPEADASFKEITDFLRNNPDWPDTQLLEKRAEAALLAEMPSDDVLDKWYAEHSPQTAQGKRRGIKNKDELNEMIRESWINDDYTKSAEGRILEHYREILRAEDHAKRIDRLLWEGKEDAAKRLLPYAPYKRHLFEARLALMQDSSQAPSKVSDVPSSQRADAGLLFDRLRWRARHADREGVRELLLSSPMRVPYPEKWWSLRERQVREALGEGNVKLAERLLARHAQNEDSVQYKEARWLQGWIELEFKKNPKEAYEIFQALYDGMETPGGKARTAYWAGRAAEKAGGQSLPWYKEATRYNTTFYGQLALLETEAKPQLVIDANDKEASKEDRRAFNGRELVRLVQVLAKAKQTNLASKFILYMVENAKSPKEAVLASRLGRDIRRIDIGVRASKKALKDGVVALDSGYPVVHVSDPAGLEKSYVLALMRQESEFFADAMSGSGAIGLMQLLPSTAKEVARKIGMKFSVQRLFDPDYNSRLGSNYLGRMVNSFDGSYVLATASYNAGPGRVRQWTNSFGYPKKSIRAIVNWIEGIPLSETRNYVQHVMGNMQVYRYMLAGKKAMPLQLGNDLMRGTVN